MQINGIYKGKTSFSVNFYHIFIIFFAKTETARFGDSIGSVNCLNIKVRIPNNYLNYGESQAN